jgi:hypothetical protein
MFTIIAFVAITGTVILCVWLVIRHSKLKPEPDKKKEAEPTDKPESKQPDKPEPKKPAVPKKPWSKKVKVGLAVVISVLGAVVAYRMFEIQIPDFRFSNAAFWVFFPIVILAGFLALSSDRKKALRVPLILFLGMLFVFWHFDVQILQMADRDGDEIGYNPMDFEAAGGPSEVQPYIGIPVNKFSYNATSFFSLKVVHVEITPNTFRIRVVWQRKHTRPEAASVSSKTYIVDNWGNKFMITDVKGLKIDGKKELGLDVPFSATLIFSCPEEMGAIETLSLYLHDLPKWGHCFIVEGIEI